MTLESERLLIRPWTHDEADRLLDIQSRVEVVMWLGDGEPVLMQDLEEAHRRVDRYAGLNEQPPLGFWAVEVRSTGVVAGSVILLTLPNDDHGEVEIGWHLHPDSWRQGIATEAASAVMQHGFDGGLPEVYAITHTTNTPSQAVCRKLDMVDLGIMTKWYDDESRVYRTTPARWAESGARTTGEEQPPHRGP